MILAVGKNQIEIAVPGQVILVNALKNAFCRYVEILPAVSKCSAAECLEAFCDPLFRFHFRLLLVQFPDHPFQKRIAKNLFTLIKINAARSLIQVCFRQSAVFVRTRLNLGIHSGI